MLQRFFSYDRLAFRDCNANNHHIRRHHLALTGMLAAAAASMALTAPARAAEFDQFLGLGALSGGTDSQAYGVSADGTTVVGSSDSASGVDAFRWSGGTMTNLGTLGGSSSSANAVSANGAVVVGNAYLAGNTVSHAFRYSGTTMTDLGTLGGTFSSANGVSADGAVVVGYAQNAGGNNHAFRYSGATMTDLGTLGGSVSQASGVSADGTTVVGNAYLTGDIANHAFRYSGATMTDLGTLGGANSQANAVSADGKVVVGNAYLTGNTAYHAFRYSGTTMTDLGTLGTTNSNAHAVSANGEVVVGDSSNVGNPVAAFRWRQDTGMKSMASLLTASNVNITGWTLTSATGISADGTVIVGYGQDPKGNTEAWLARCTTSCAPGTPGTVTPSFALITPGIVAQSFAGQAAIGGTANAAIGDTLGTMNEYATQATQTQGVRNTRFSVFGYGTYDSDPVASGSLGMTVDLPRGVVIGATVGANAIRTDMVFNGSAKMSGGAAGAFIAHVPDAGLQWLAAIGGSTITGDVTRGYLNGNDPAYSKGSTGGRGGGAMARIGWAFNDLLPKTQLTPFASYTAATTSFDGYLETGGPFPASFAPFTSTAQTARLGTDARYTFAPGKWLWGTVAWAHRVDGGKAPDIAGTVIGLFSMAAPGISSTRDWAELTGGIRLPVWSNGSVTASVTTSLVPNQRATFVSRLGIAQAF
jgi:probable HAF family extracellular repeat protein